MRKTETILHQDYTKYQLTTTHWHPSCSSALSPSTAIVLRVLYPALVQHVLYAANITRNGSQLLVDLLYRVVVGILHILLSLSTLTYFIVVMTSVLLKSANI